ncbi:MAG: S9 family peptidase, partial [Bacteroidales bacterium]|nr:S9 family peptidase [Bacteroidales bacterium]
MKQSDFPTPPVAEVKPDTFVEFSHQRIDNYYWMRDKTDPKVVEYLHAENAYTDTVMASTKDLQEAIYNEILGRMKEDDESYPTLKDGYYYYSRSVTGKQYPTYCRKKGTMDASEEIIFDVNEMAEGKAAFIFRGYSISPDNSKAAYFFNETGSYADFNLHIKDLASGEDVGFTVSGATSVAWANDNKTLFFGVVDKNTLRSYQIRRQMLDAKESTLVYQEDDAKFSTYVSGNKTKDYIFIGSSSSTTSEERYIAADNPNADFKVFMPRVKDVEYSVYVHKNNFFVQYKDKENLNSKIFKAPFNGYEDKATWTEFVAHDPNVRIERIDILIDYVSLEMRKNGLTQIELMPVQGGEPKSISFPEPVYSTSLIGNPEYEASTIRYSYTSLNRPTTLYEYNIEDGATTKLKEQEVPSGFNPDDYTVERVWATASDGVEVPMAIVYKKELKKDGSNPALIYSYGSYGMSSDVYFSTAYYSLIDRGFVFAIAQIRGGSDLGEQWYEDGKLLKKKNTFTDFIACSEKLIEDKYTSADKLAAMGGSAGGLLMGAVANMRPDLYQTIVAQVPFVDVITTMFDETLPLTTGEYEEWGNPNEEEYYNYIKSYSPY